MIDLPNVIVPFTRLHPVTEAVLKSYRNITIEWCGLGHDDAYRGLLQRLWSRRKTVVIVEHDIVPWEGAIEDVYYCRGAWCTCSYRWEGALGLSHMLGFAKISAELMAALPTLWDEPCHWSKCDQKLFFAARDIGMEPHQHRPSVLHLKGIAA